MKLLEEFSARISNISVEEDTFTPFFYEQIKSVSPSLYQALNKDQITKNVDFSLKKYWNRAKYRATPFALFSRLIFSEKSKSISQKIVIPELSKITVLPSSKWIYNYLSRIKLKEYHNFSFSIKKNSVIKVFDHFHQIWTIDGKDGTIEDSKPLEQVLFALEQEENLFTLQKTLKKQNLDFPLSFLKKLLDELVSEDYLTTVFDSFKLMTPSEFIGDYSWTAFLQGEDREKIEELISLVKHFNSSCIQKTEELQKIENFMKSLMESTSYLEYFSSSDILMVKTSEKDSRKTLENFSTFLSNYSNEQPENKKYAEDVLLFKERFGNVKIRFNDFYNYYQQKRELIINNAKSVTNEKLESYILSKTDFSEQYNTFQSVDLLDYELNSSNTTSESPTAQLSMSVFEDNNEINFLISPEEGTLGISNFESRFEHLSNTYVEKLRKIEREKFKELGINLYYINIYPRNPRYFSIIPNADINHALNFGMDEQSGIHFNELFIEVDNNKFLITNKENQQCYFAAKNMANLSFLATEKIQDLSHWSAAYFRNNLALFRDMELFKEKHGYLPEIKFGNITLKPLSIKMKHLFKTNDTSFNGEKLKQLKTRFPDKIFRIISRDQGFVLTEDTSFNLKAIKQFFKENPNANFEILPDYYGKSIISDQRGHHYHNEFIFNFVSQTTNKSSIKIREESLIPAAKHEWIQINFFIPVIYQNEFVQSYLARLLAEIHFKNTDAKMFYIRYFDDRHLVRVRFKNISSSCLFSIIDELNAYYEVSENQVEIGNYSPEIARYGLGDPKLMEAAENYFCEETELILKNKKMLIDKSDKFELFFVLVSFILRNYTQNRFKLKGVLERNFDKAKFSSDFRKDRKRFTALFQNYYASSNLPSRLINSDLLLSSLISYLKALENINADGRDQVLSLIHMLGNRLFGIERKFEDQCLNYFFRILISEMARSKTLV